MERSPTYYHHFSNPAVPNLRPRKRLSRLCAESDDNPPNKQLVTEERMAEHMKRLSIDQGQGFRTVNSNTYKEPSYRQPFCASGGARVQPTSCGVVHVVNGSSDNEELVSLLRGPPKCTVPVIQLSPPTPVQSHQDNQKSTSNCSVILEDFDSSDDDVDDNGGDEGLQISHELQDHIRAKQAELITSALVESMRSRPCMDLVLWTPQDRFVQKMLEKVNGNQSNHGNKDIHSTQGSKLENELNYYDDGDDTVNMDT